MGRKEDIDTARASLAAAEQRQASPAEIKELHNRLTDLVATHHMHDGRARLDWAQGATRDQLTARQAALAAERAGIASPVTAAAWDARTEPERRLIEARIAQAPAPKGDPLAAPRQAIRETHARLASPFAQAAFRLRNEWAWDEPEDAA